MYNNIMHLKYNVIIACIIKMNLLLLLIALLYSLFINIESIEVFY